MNTYLFIAACILSIITIIIYTFVSSANHKTVICRKSPYYFCDTDWLCCKNESVDGKPLLCDVTAGGPSTSGNEANAYFLTDQLYGTNKGTNPSGNNILVCNGSSKTYYEACIEPVKLITSYYNTLNQAVDPNVLDCLYSTSGSSCNITKFNEFKTTFPQELSTLTQGQCCYQQFDPLIDPKTGQTIGQYYPKLAAGVTSNGAWNDASVYAGQYAPNTQGYAFPPSKLDTTNNSCYNTFFGGPIGATNAPYRYAGCPGA